MDLGPDSAGILNPPAQRIGQRAQVRRRPHAVTYVQSYESSPIHSKQVGESDDVESRSVASSNRRIFATPLVIVSNSRRPWLFIRSNCSSRTLMRYSAFSAWASSVLTRSFASPSSTVSDLTSCSAAFFLPLSFLKLT